MLQGGNFIVRRSALEAIGGFNTDIDFYGEDTDIARRMQEAGRIKFTFRLPMLSSGRRMAKEGLIATGLRYAVNYMWILLFKRPFHTKSTDVRFLG
jgi:cellulose synthase/poly-beta-1,6-N-acetylglucosamine synthase-like glycosyltransferase